MKNNFDKLDKHFPPTSWNETTAPFPDQHCIHQLFENCVHKYPAQDALIFEQDSMSYQELNQRSNQLAHYLRESGVKPETLVGIHIERSFDMIIAILAVFKAGGAYVPLDPNYPAERLAFILKDAQLTVCLTQQHLADKFSFKIKQSLNTICLDTHQHKIESYSIDNPVLHTTADNLAYVIYTSGSTGQPKGVLLEHRGLCNLVTLQNKLFTINCGMRVLQFATLNFDASIWEIVTALCSSATLVLAKKENVLPTAPLLDLLTKQKVNFLSVPPSILSLLPVEKLPHLKIIVAAGEACSVKIAKQWAAHTQFFNGYGLTETTVCATMYPFLSTSSTLLPIGKQIINSQLFLLDSALSPVKIGEIGELYIAGVNLARGYLNRPELTKTRFIQNPFNPTERLYKTGDLAQYLADGNLVFMGRVDDQVKIRGLRIELGEIEETLKQHSTITDAKVLVKGDSEENKHLVAYVASELVSTERLPLEVNCDLSLPDNPSVRYTSFTRDISCYGVCVKNTITKKMKKDQYINIELYLPKTKKGLALKGKVAWSSSHALGVLFDRPEKTNVCEKIQRLLEINGFTTFLQRTKSAHLRSFLQQRMPSYMMPANFVFFKKLPLTANGKIDKQALLQLDERPQQHKSNIAQKITTPTEVQVATVWKKALHLPEIDYEEDFIALGGHSLLAVKIANELSTLFNIVLPFHALLENPSIKQISHYIDSEINEIVNHRSTVYHQPITPIGRHGFYPLSHYQQQLWLHAQLSSTVYNETSTIYFDQAIDTHTLEKALNLLLKRHDALRSNFLIHNDTPVQKIISHHAFHLPIIDLRAQFTNKAVRIQQALKLATEDAIKAFNLENDRLFRALLIKISDTDYRLYLTMYHLIFDGDSLKNTFLPELEKVYTCLHQGENIVLPSLTLRYSDFSYWQRQQFNAEMLAPHLAYWRYKLKDLSDLQLPSDYPRSETAIFRGSTHCFKVNKRLTEQLKQLAKEEEVTLFMLLLTALKVLIYRYTDETDIHIGTVIADDHPDMTGVMGYFLNTMIFRSNLSENPIFTELLQQVKATTLEGYHHAIVPFDKLIAELNPKRQLNTSYLSRIAFTVEPIDVESKAGWSLSYFDIHTGQAKSDITIEMDETPQGFIGRIEYRTDLFKPETIECFAQHYTELLHNSVLYPHEHIDNLPLLSVAEQKKVLFQWNQTEQSYPHEHCIHELFAECVLEYPDEIAVVSEQGELSYYELNTRANQLAHYLREQGVGLETFVGICVERSEKMIIAMLAVLKAGGTYIPIDASYPIARLEWMIEDSAMPVLITQSSLNITLPIDTINTIVDLDSITEQLTNYSPRSPKNMAHANSLAYVIYTSGSTGKPKGVLLEHQGLCNLVTAQIESFNLGKNKKMLQFASFSFDASISECFTTLCSGATLYLFERNTIAVGEPLYQQLKNQAITTVTLTPSTLVHLPDNPLPDLETLVVAGEACPLPLMKKWADKCRFINAYGPTETTVCASLIPCHTTDSQITIGHPIANTQLYILNEALQPVPIGVTGELYIGGVGLAREYLNQPTLSAQRFIKNPFSFTASERLYKTGDLAHYLADGRIMYHGRIDNQVKLRGHRIELGEIEAVLTQHPNVKEAVVLVNNENNQGSDKQLHAYISPNLVTSSDDSLNEERLAQKEVEHISYWKNLYKDVYHQDDEKTDLAFNITGWGSSYTGEAIPTPHMQAWVNDTVKRIVALNPTTVLEIGCGSGLLLARIAAKTQKYWGSDLSKEVLIPTKKLIDKKGYDNVLLFNAAAHDFSQFQQQTFDTLVLNSVVQYFPNINYLYNVIEQAITHIESNGKLFLGDIRNFDLLAIYHSSIQCYKANKSTQLDVLNYAIAQGIQQEEELTVSPDFFYSLQLMIPRISYVEVQLKQSHFTNELNKFRYDVVLHLDTKYQTPETTEISWHNADLDIQQIRTLLTADQQKEYYTITHIPNPRLIQDVAVYELLETTQHSTLKEVESHCAVKMGIDPSELYQLAEELNYKVYITWSAQLDQYEASFFPLSDLEKQILTPPNITPRSWETYANQPLVTHEKQLASHLPQDFINQIKTHLATHLPSYMIPTTFIGIDKIPLTANGKVDQQLLTQLDYQYDEEEKAPFIHPRNAIEVQLLSLWEKILKHDTISVNNDFFELGGHSLLGVKLLVGIENIFQQKFDLSFLFKASTIEKQAVLIEKNVPLAETSLVPIQTRGNRTPFFCLPGVGGNVTYLHDLAKALGKEQPFYGLQSIGLQGDVEPFNTVEEIATHFIQEIQAIQAHGPYLLGGHSSGGIFAYEVAQQLRAKGEHIAGLIVLDVPVFKFPVDHLNWSDEKWFITVVMVLEHLLNTSLSICEEDIKDLTYSQCLSLLLQQMQQCHLLPENTTITQIQGIVNVLKVNELALLKYPSRNKPYHDIPVTLCRTEEVYMHDDIDFNIVIPDDETWGWQDLTQYPVSVIQVEGGHTTMLQAPYVSMLAKGITAYIDTHLHTSEIETIEG